jgi:CBS domain-containing protein
MSSVTDVMSRELLTAREDTGYKQLVEVMLDGHVSGLPVLDAHGRLTGIVTEGDLVRKVAFGGSSHHPVLSLLSRWLTGKEAYTVLRVEGLTAADIMSQPVVSIGPDETVATAAKIMLRHRVKRLPVLDEQYELVGVVSRSDLVRSFLVSDDEIAEAVRRILRNSLAVPEDNQLGAAVENGVVMLSGTVARPSDVELIEAVIRRMVPGVVGIQAQVRATGGSTGAQR